MLLSILVFASCKDDDNELGSDINTPITGYWTLGNGDFNSSGTETGIIVHEDGTVSEWQYSLTSSDPDDAFKLGYKTGSWTTANGHYEMQLNKGNNQYYTVTVAGNNDKELILSYNGKKSAVPLYRTESLPGNGNAIVASLNSMKFSDFQISDFEGYWEMKPDQENAYQGNGFYIDSEGKESQIGTSYGQTTYRTISYQYSKVSFGQKVTFQFVGYTYTVYAVGKDVILATPDGENIVEFDRKTTPQIVTDAYNFMNEKVDSKLLGTWETTNYTDIIGNDTISNIDITPSDNWSMQMYKKLVFQDNTIGHIVTEYDQHNSQRTMYFRYNTSTQTLIVANELNALLNQASSTDFVESYTLTFNAETEMVLTRSYGTSKEIYTYMKQ